MRKLALSLLVLCFALSPALAQRPQEQFPTYVLGKPTAAPPGPADRLPLIQGGVTRQLPAIATTSQPGLVYPDGTTISINSAGKITSIGGGGGGTPANPTATASDIAVNGAALTYMRSDAAPAVQKGTNGAFGLIKCDGVTTTCAGGVISSLTGGAGTVTNASNLTDHAPVIGNGGTVGIKTTTAMTNGQLLVGVSAADPAPQTLSGDGALTSSGVLTITKTNGTNFSALATTVPGTGVATALTVNVGTAGAVVVNGGAGGTPSSLTLSNAVGLPLASGVTGVLQVGNGGIGVGTMAANSLVKGNGGSAFSPAALSDDGTKISTSEPIDLTSKPIEWEVANAGSTGTTLNKLAKLTGAPATAVITATTDLDGAVGIVNGGAGTAGTVRIATSGQVSCVFDGVTTAGNYVTISPTVAGDCRDAGSTRPLGTQVIGRVLTTNGSGGTYAVQLAANFTPASGSGTVTNPSNLTTHAPLVGGANGTTDAKALAAMTNGQLAIGSTGADPVPALPTAATPNLVVTGGAGSLSIGTTVPINTQSGNSAYTILAGDAAKLVQRTNTVTQTDPVPQATGSFASGFDFAYKTATVGNTLTSTTSTINGIAGATGIKLGIQQSSEWLSDGANWNVALGVPQPATQTGTTVLYDNMTWGSPGGSGTIIPNSIGGCALSSPSTTTAGMAACVAADSTNAVLISQASAFTKSISGAWAAGSGSNGMGNGLTATLNTWYHVCFGNSDYWFDTSVSCANRPGGLSGTDKRRIGSVLLDASVHILPFVDYNGRRSWGTQIADTSNHTFNTTPAATTVHTPPGVASEVDLSLAILNTATVDSIFVYNPDSAGVTSGNMNPMCSTISATNPASCHVSVVTNTTPAVNTVTQTGSLAGVYIYTNGYRDFRGQ